MATGNEIQNNTGDAPDAISIRFEELTSALQDAEELVSNLREANHTQGKFWKAKLLSTQTRYQNAMNTLAQTKGQISILTEQLSTQDHECARLAVAIELMQSMTD